MPRETEQDRTTRRRFRAFLEPLVRKSRNRESRAPYTVTQLDAMLSKTRQATLGVTPSDKGDPKSIYDYLSGIQTVTPERAWWIGEALNRLGAEWCSGPIALHAAGHLSDFIGVLSVMNEMEREVATARFLYGAGAPKRDPSLGRICRAELKRAATETCQHAREIWMVWSKNARARTTNASFRAAIAVASETAGLPFHDRENTVFTVLDTLWGRPHKNPQVREIAARFKSPSLREKGPRLVPLQTERPNPYASMSETYLEAQLQSGLPRRGRRLARVRSGRKAE
jgi:hypothetical protein